MQTNTTKIQKKFVPIVEPNKSNQGQEKQHSTQTVCIFFFMTIILL